MHQPPTSAVAATSSLIFALPQVNLDLKGFKLENHPNSDDSHLPPKKRFNRSGSNDNPSHTLNTPYYFKVHSGPSASSAAAHPYQPQQHWSQLFQPPNYRHPQQLYYHHHQTPLQMLSAAAAAAASALIVPGPALGNHFSPSGFSTSSSRLSDTSADSGVFSVDEHQQKDLQEENKPLDLSMNTSSVVSPPSVKNLQISNSTSSNPKTRPYRKAVPSKVLKLRSSKQEAISTLCSILSCPECGKVYSSSSRFRAHLRRHESKQSGRYRCTVCAKNFVQRSSLKTHERIHTGERPYHCQLCDQRFGDFSTFTKHRRTHTGEKPYSCPHCSKAFSQSGNMHRHRATVHGNSVGTKVEKSEDLESWVH